MSTMWSQNPRWSQHVDFYVTDRFGTPSDLRELLRRAHGKEGVILLGSVTRRHLYRDFVLALLLKARPGPRPRILFTDATWQPGSNSLSRLTRLPASWFAMPQKVIVRLIDGPHVRYGVLSTDELETFPRRWGVDPERVLFTPFPATIGAHTPTTDGDYLFAGGNSLRDYDLLAQALAPHATADSRHSTAQSTPEPTPVVVAADWAPASPLPNARVGPVSHEEFVSLLAGCRAAVVPLVRAERSAGQQSYLNAMLLAKPVIVTEAPGVRDYIEDGVTGVVVPPDADALRAAIHHVMDPANAAQYTAMGRRARERVLARFTGERYQDDVLLAAIGLPREPAAT